MERVGQGKPETTVCGLDGLEAATKSFDLELDIQKLKFLFLGT
jgi:hypothetical protein